MGSTGMIRPHAMGMEPARGLSIMGEIDKNESRHIKRKGRTRMEEEKLSTVGLRTLGVTAGGFAVGMVQGFFGTSRIGGVVPGELIGGVALHAVALFGIPPEVKFAVRALGDGALAVGMS